MVVTGYSRDLYQEPRKEAAVEAWIRAQANTLGSNEGKFSIVVLSGSMPDEQLFHDSSLPWYNGPFQGSDCVWSIESDAGRVKLIRHDSKSKIVREPSIREVVSWVNKSEFLYP